MKMLSGVRVLDLTMWAFCPSAGAALAEWGADVIHIENPKSPDPMRLFGGNLDHDGASWYFKHYNRGKRSIGLDLTTQEGRDVLYKLVAESDVFLTSFLPKTRRKLGFDIDQLRAINPNIIYAKGTGAGPLGPENERGGYDGASWWARGSLAWTAQQVSRTDAPPAMIGHGDGMSGLVFAGGICAALFHRATTGEPVTVDSSLLGTAAWFSATAIIGTALGPDRSTQGHYTPREDTMWYVNNYRTGGDRWIFFNMMGDFQDEFIDLCQHIGRLDLVDDPRFASTETRAEHSVALLRLLDEVFIQKSFEEWKQILYTLKGVWAPVQSLLEMLDDPQVNANGMVRMITDTKETQAIVMTPLMFNEGLNDCHRAPDFAEHTDEILQGICGLEPEEIARLKSTGALA